MTLAQWQERLHEHFEDLRHLRTAAVGDKPIFALEHGLDADELQEIATLLSAHVAHRPPSEDHSLPWAVYSAEVGYRYSGDEYWQTFEQETPGWLTHGTRQALRDWLRGRYWWFHRRFGGARPVGPWADHFSIICWPITHAILPRDLQRQLARTLYQLRYQFSGDLFATPAELGKLIAARAWDGTSRFQNLLQEPALMGQIAAALLLEGQLGSASLLLPSTLKRIGADVERERVARGWLQNARRVAQAQAQFRGLSVARTSPSSRRTDAARGRDEAATLGIEPRLILRPTELGRASWDVFLEIPDLSPLLFRFPDTRETLANSRCTVAGAAGHPLARGRLLHHGPQKVLLARWPGVDELLLRFEPPSPQLDFLLHTESLLRPGPTWLFLISSDGLAREIRSLQVRPGQTYVVVTTTGPIRVDGRLAEPTALSCDGVYGALLDLPPTISKTDSHFLDALGLSHAKTIRVRPAGLAAAEWDGQGRAEWLTTERPCIAIRSDHALASIVVGLANRDKSALDLGPVTPGDEAFVELPSLPAGQHTVRVHAREHVHMGDERVGELVVTVRQPRVWEPGAVNHGLLVADIDPAAPTLEQLWEGHAQVELSGPAGHQVSCTVALFEREGQPLPMASARLPPLGLPITSTVWRRHFERVCQEHSDVQQAYDTARFCEVEFAADDLGTLRIRCERTFTPLRWVVRHSSHGDLIMLVDDTGSSESVDVGRYAFDFPDRKEHLGPELFSQHMAVSASGGLYFARQGDFTAAVILPPTVRALAGLACDPRASDRRRSVENTMRLIQLAELWAFAHPTGNLLSRLRQHQVLRGLTRELFLLLGGATWGRAERLRLEGEARLRALARAVPSGRRESRLGLAIGRDAMNLVSVTNRQRVTFLASVATRILGLSAPAGTVVWERAGVRLVRKRPEHPEWLCEFALRLASAPHNAPSWAGTDVATGVSQLLALPVLARAARLLVLAVEHHTDEEPRAIGTSRLYAGWEWT